MRKRGLLPGARLSGIDSAVAGAGLVLIITGGSLFDVLPLLATGVAGKLGFSTQQDGEMSSVLTVASGVSGLLAALWVRALSWRRAGGVALCGVCLCLFAGATSRNSTIVVLMVGTAGFFGSAAFALGSTIISECRDPIRTFGIAICGQAAFQIGILSVGPSLLSEFSGLRKL